MKPFTESDKLAWPLNKDSVVVEVGAHHGDFSEQAKCKWGCRVIALEPISKFYFDCIERFKASDIVVFRWALGEITRLEEFGIHGSMSGAFSDGDRELVKILGVVDFLEVLKLERISLISINCEGGEYEILECILKNGLANRFDAIQVQPHSVVQDFESRWKAIDEGLQKTHELVWHEPWCWSGYKLRI